MKRSGKRKGYIIAIDGPSGSGKSTITRALAKRLSGRLLDTGAMYRSVGYFALKEGVGTKEAFSKIAKRLKFSAGKSGRVLLVNGENLGRKLRTEKVAAMASYVSKFKPVRKVLTEKQREIGRLWARHYPVIVEGRDIGTVVFPKNVCKFFVTANVRERARRRQAQLKKMGQKKVTISAVLLKIAHRDQQDSKRKEAPLRKAADAIVVNTSGKALNEVIEFIEKRLPH